MKPVKCTWDEFKKLVEKQCAEEYCQWCYRGQQNEKNKLKTSLHRMIRKSTISSLGAYFDNWVIEKVRQYISSILGREIKVNSDDELISFLALLQHHGFPTPLLDWTLSPYIAAYFAFRNAGKAQPKGRNVAVYAFNCAMIFSADIDSKTYKANADIKQDKIKYIKLVKPMSFNNPRLIPQQSVCMMTNIERLEDWICRTEKNIFEKQAKEMHEIHTPHLIKILLNVNEAKTIKKDLNLMGINEMTMFPTVDGVCGFLSEKMFSLGDIGNL